MEEKNDQPPPLIIEKTYDAPVAKVWRALTDNEEMKQWYFTLAEFKAEAGFKFEFAGAGKDGEEILHLCEVMEVVPEKKISYTWRYEGLPGNSLLSFELFAEGEKTKLILTHSGLESFAGNGPSFEVASFTEGWNMIIGRSLKEFVEK